MDEDAIYNRHQEVFLLWACRETGVIEALLDEPREAESLAAATGVTPRAARITLGALEQFGHVQQTDGGYAPAETLETFDPDCPPLERGILPHRVDSLENYMALPEIMRTGEPPAHTEAGFRNYVGAMATLDDAIVREAVTIAEHAHPRPDRVLDVGAGAGKFGAEFDRRGATVTLFDRAHVLDLLADHHRDLGLEAVAGDARESLPTGFDLVFSARMTASFTTEALRDFFANAREALDPGGTFVNVAWVRGHSEIAERFGVHTMTISATGDTHPEATYRAALEDVGFRDVTFSSVPHSEFQAIVAHSPE